MYRILRHLILGFALLMLVAPAVAQDYGRVVEVVEVAGPLDGRLIRFVSDSILEAAEGGNVELIVLQIDSPGALTDDGLGDLADLVANPPVPVVAWIGPSPAVAYGAAAQMFTRATVRVAAPGSALGYFAPTVAGAPDMTPIAPIVADLAHSTVKVDGPIAGLIDVVSPAVRQLIQNLDGTEFATRTGPVVVNTIRPFTADDGTTGVTALETVILEPHAWDRLLRLASRPEAAFFFLVAGLTVAAFEFYAIGPGIAAGVATVSLTLAGYGIAVLPVRWWALGLITSAVVALAASYQVGGILGVNVLALGALTVAGFWFTDAGPQITPGAAGVLLTIVAAGFFFLIAMPTVARSRFSTQTIGREHLIDRTGVAASDFDPDGMVDLDGAIWRATAHREAGISTGDEVVVTGVDGTHLEVGPTSLDREIST